MRDTIDDSSSDGCSAADPSDDTACDNATKGTEAKDGSVAIANQETKDVVRLKTVVALVLMISTAAVASTVHYNMSSNEHKNFRNAFDDDSEKILSAVSGALDSILGSFDSLAVTTVSMARQSNQTWPFVTFPDFGVRMSKFVPLSRTFVVYLSPIVTPAQRKEWEEYVVKNDAWVNECADIQDDYSGYFLPHEHDTESYGTIHGDFEDVPYNVSRVLLPEWQNFPVAPNTVYTYGWDWLSATALDAPMACLNDHKVVFSQPYMIPTPGDKAKEEEAVAWGEYLKRFNAPHENPIEPVSDLFYPIIEQIDRVHVAGADDYNPADHTIVGVWGASIYWRSIFQDTLPKDSTGIQVVVENECSLPWTYQINGPTTYYMGVGDRHETKYDSSFSVHRRLDALAGIGADGSMYSGPGIHETYCPFTIHIYPSDEMKNHFVTNGPTIFTVAVIMIFAFTALVFLFYDWKVERRQKTVLSSATRSSAIVSSLFPSEVRDQLYPLTGDDAKQPKFRPGFKGDVGLETSRQNASPIASLYPNTTVLFADIVGFTAWSSVRQPSQVFNLLETIYAAFDEVAKQRGVFKVETIGDSYVAVAGLPTPKKHHAVVMARFASDCRRRMRELVIVLETTLGPGTADLAMRFGLNSGPTTGGVLRGEKARFQLFGDTVNTAARMESNGQRDRIQVSQKTADLIIQAGKGHWLTPREDKVDCKGKGMMTTFWCDPNASAESVGTSETSQSETLLDSMNEAVDTSPDKQQRLVGWNVDLFVGLLKDVIKQRATITGNQHQSDFQVNVALVGKPIDEVAEAVTLLACVPSDTLDHADVTIDPNVLDQMENLVLKIAGKYNMNPFHNFDHASHVTMSTKKLLDRIDEHMVSDTDHKASSGTIVFDPLTKFAIVFAALIHDIDHPGVSNAQLVHEKDALSVVYSGRSVAEQNSIDLAWSLLMDAQFADLQHCLLATDAEAKQFRQVLVNAVMASDLFDKDLKQLRESRWMKTFGETSSSRVEGTNAHRRAAIVIDLVIQASDVSHTMQYFTVYKAWNLRLLTEMYEAYQAGRSATNPLDGWYEGELSFFDHYIIPLAEKLRACGVFGVSCDEFLDYAKDNRTEWESKGRDIVRDAADSLRCSRVQKAVLLQQEEPMEI